MVEQTLPLPLLPAEVLHDLDPDLAAIFLVRIDKVTRIEADELHLLYLRSGGHDSGEVSERRCRFAAGGEDLCRLCSEAKAE